MSARDWRSFGRLHTKLYKLLGGRFVGSVGLGRKVLLLTTTGRKSGLERTTPLVYMPHSDDVIVYPSNGGKEAEPAWWLNLQTNPTGTIQLGKTTHQVQARRATAEEYAALWPQAEQYNPHWRTYAQTVARLIPLVLLEGHFRPLDV
jgi:deazaflavin-dependent oxidoreductase (nitroreductase family)